MRNVNRPSEIVSATVGSLPTALGVLLSHIMADFRTPTGNQLHIISRVSFLVYYLLFITYCLLPTVYYLLFITYCLLPTVYYLLFITYCLLPTVYYLLFITYPFYYLLYIT